MSTNSLVSFNKSIIAILALTALLSACAGLRSDYDAPTVTVKSFRALPSQGAMPGFEIVLNVLNPNRDPLELIGVSYTIRLNGRDLVKGVGNELPVIEGYGSGDLTLSASASMYSGIRFFGDLMKSQSDSIRYEVEAKLDTGTFRRAIRVRDSGEFSLQSSTAD
ncbi:MAG: LEA type 2 family protein [Gammaproteobacteria bacterium]|nr:LEA type 2 family protein [Gammaproteobacteria bacterium]NNL51104.1 LEA type 2 family protein [Woeseiaceae bacterium]